MKVKGIFTEKDKRNGKAYIVVSKYWPDGERYRRRMPSRTVANNVMARINASIVEGTWRELRTELEHGSDVEKDYTISEFADVYLEEYCRKRNTRPDFKAETLETIKDIIGDVRLREFSRSDALRFETERGKKVSAATVNRGLAVLSNMLTYAFKRELIDSRPMMLYGRLPEKTKERRFLTLEEERRLVAAVLKQDPAVGAYVGILGETGLRMEEGLGVKWDHVNLADRILTVPGTNTKNGQSRHIPLSDYAIELLNGLPRVIGQPWVFVRQTTWRQLRAPRKEFEAGKKAAKLTWVKGFHDLRHFRASQWVRSGIDPRTVKELLGHRDIKTTMIYAHFDPKHAHKAVLEAQRKEA